MRFNPPPDWPQMPAGWSPPPGWEPPPSYPQPPYGWPLWIAEDEFVISPYRAAASQAEPTQPWHQRTVFIVLFLVFFLPVGLVLLWLRSDWSVWWRGIVTAVAGIVLITVVANLNPPPTKTTVINPTVVSGTASPSHTPAPSKPAVPSPVVTKSRTPATSAPPKTTAAAAPVQTSAAPAYTPPPAPAPTTQAPQAPQTTQTTTQAQSCYPLTDGGNCYEPGEYCRDDDHGVSGIDGDGDAITCEDNDGWRWERS